MPQWSICELVQSNLASIRFSPQAEGASYPVHVIPVNFRKLNGFLLSHIPVRRLVFGRHLMQMAEQQVTQFFVTYSILHTTLTLRFWEQHIPNIYMEANPSKVKPYSSVFNY